MSQTTTVTVTSQTGLELVNGKLWAQYDALIAQLTARLSERHAFLFARPEKALSTGPAKVAWLAEDLGEPVRVSSLPPEQQERAAAELARLEADLHTLAEQMKQEGPVSAEFARLIQDALARPPGDWVWLVGDRPVLVNWGYRIATDDDRIPEKPRTLVAEGAAVKLPPPPGPQQAPPPRPTPSSPPPPSPAPPSGPVLAAYAAPSRWPLAVGLWLLFAALVGLSGYRLLQACTLSPVWPSFIQALLPPDCRAVASDPEADLRARAAEAEADVRAREQAILVKLAQCPLVCRADPAIDTRPPPIPDPVPDTIKDINGRLEDVKRGKIELDLLWNGGQDLDLSVGCPNGQKIDFSNRDQCQAQFELDVNANPGSERIPPIEHIIWNDDQAAPSGTYTVFVTYYKPGAASALDVPFQVFLNRHYSCDGQDKVQTLASETQGVAKITEQQKKLKVFTFQMPFPPPPSCRS